jgi:hypothetical protein
MGLSVAALKGRVFYGRRKLQGVLKDGSAMSPLLKRESDLLSEDQSDVEPCLTEREYYADIPTRATAESSSPVLFSTIASRGRQAMNGNGVNDGFETSAEQAGLAERYWISFGSSRLLTQLLSSKPKLGQERNSSRALFMNTADAEIGCACAFFQRFHRHEIRTGAITHPRNAMLG